jgi:hypothetical protein
MTQESFEGGGEASVLGHAPCRTIEVNTNVRYIHFPTRFEPTTLLLKLVETLSVLNLGYHRDWQCICFFLGGGGYSISNAGSSASIYSEL